eukprot:scaffold552_cov526-Prasinococcus_capsulatus_cf.AAC.8
MALRPIQIQPVLGPSTTNCVAVTQGEAHDEIGTAGYRDLYTSNQGCRRLQGYRLINAAVQIELVAREACTACVTHGEFAQAIND